MSNASPGRGRTVLLSIVVVLAVIVVALVGKIVFDRVSEPDEQAGPASSSVASSSSPTSSSSTSSSTAVPSRTRPTAPPGSVTYQLTGSGDVITLTFATGSGTKVVVAAGAPWSQATTVKGRKATMDAIVTRGTVTCTILHGEDLIASSTSRGGPLHCSGRLPR
ncbi:hypothetical protein [Gordonia shandongensis]|uniref:hypothetical protein n=1 Tax=Gordonia shandongensis TaxID=376351 RepID=UPI00040E5B36|nr:hypothetical protein [Gordonia shandongensis]